MSTSFIGEIEIGRKYPSAKTLQKIADSLGMKPFELLLDTPDRDQFDRFEVLSRLYEELKTRIDDDLAAVFRKYLG